MKKCALVCLLLLLFALPALAEPARDITGDVKLRLTGTDKKTDVIRDKDESTGISVPGNVKQYLYITPGADSVAAVYIQFGLECSSIDVEVKGDAGWQTIASYDNPGHFQAALSFPPQSEQFRLRFRPVKQQEKLYIRELYLYSEGELAPEQAHSWQPAVEKADILFLVAHPDDELLWFGGAIPASADAGRRMQVAYLTCSSALRRQELLNGLWHCGMRTYPDIGRLKDMTGKQSDVMKVWGSNTALNRMVRLIRRYRPEVIVTHDAKGEYGHVQHVLCARLLREAVPLAADPTYRTGDLSPWQTKKVYLHLGKEPTTRMDWSLPLASQGGKTGLELAAEGFAMHRSQNQKKYAVAAPGDPYDSTLYTLVLSTVGEDARGNDFFENIPPEALEPR